MASRIKGITIEIDGNTTKLQQSLKEVNSVLRTTQSDLKDINKLLKMDPGNVDLLRQKQQGLTDAIKATKEKLDIEKQALEQLKNADQTPEVVRQQQLLQREIAEDEAKLKSLTNELKEFGSVGLQQVKAVGDKFQEVGDKIKAAGRSISNVGRDMTTKVTTPIVAGFGAAVKATADFDASLAKVTALSGKVDAESLEKLAAAADAMGISWDKNADVADQGLEILRNKARQVAAETQYDANEVADAFQYMALAGWEPVDMLNGISGVMDLAAASGEDLAMVSDIVTDGLTAFGYGAEETERFVDVLAQTMSKSNTTVEMLGEAFKYAAPVAGALGYEIEDVSLAFGLMANSGIKASTAGTTMRSMLTRMAKPTKESEAAMARLGITLQNDEGEMYSFKEIVDQLRVSFKDINMPLDTFIETTEELNQQLEDGQITEKEYEKALDEYIKQTFNAEQAEKARAAAMLAGQRGMSGLLAIVNASDEDYARLTENIYNATGAAEEMRNIMMDSLAGEFKVLMSNVKELGIQFADILTPHIRSLVDTLTAWVQKLQEMDPAQKEMIVTIALIVAAIGPVLLVVGKLVTAIGGITSAIGSVMSSLPQLSAALAGISAPVAVVVGVIATLVAAFIHLWNTNDEFRQKITDAWERIQSAISGFVKGISERLEAFGITFDSVSSFIHDLWNKLCEFLAPAFESAFRNVAIILDAVTGTLLGILDVFIGLFTGDWDTALQGISEIFTSVFNGISEFFSGILDDIKGAAERAVQFLIDVFNFDWELPKVKLPHFKVSGEFSLNPPSMPSFSVDWYKKAYDNPILFQSPTVIPTLGGMKGFGDGNGAELVIGMDRLKQLVGGGTQNISIIINTQPNQSPDEIADTVIDRLTFKMNQYGAAYAS